MIGIGYWIILGVTMLISIIVSTRLKNKFAKYSLVPTAAGMTGKEVAEKMLRDNRITDVKVESVQGHLTDHYNPANKTINLSPEVYGGRSVAAAAVAAHETGHAVQHATAYYWLGLRSKMVPAVSFSSKALSWLYIAMIVVGYSASIFPQMLLAIIILQGAITLFSLVTLPVEIDASRRALVWLNAKSNTGTTEHAMATDALKWAALTYVVAALASLAMLMYYIMIFMRRR